MNSTFKELYGTHLKYIEYLLERSHLYHKSLKNIKETGDDVEIEIRNFIKYFIPNRFRVTHGYIAYIKDNESDPIISPQIDLIIVDELVQNRIFSLGKSEGIDIVPVESVVGIIEIKRTLNDKSLTKSITHISKIKKSVGVVKDNADYYLPGGDLTKDLKTGFYSNPFIGIISLANEFSNPQDEFVTKFSGKLIKNEIDAVISLDGFLGCLIDQINGNILIKTVREKGEKYWYGFLSNDKFSKASLISRSIGIIIYYLSHTTGKRMKFENYFFNRNNWEIIKSRKKNKI
jgi:hypothetical protein